MPRLRRSCWWPKTSICERARNVHDCTFKFLFVFSLLSPSRVRISFDVSAARQSGLGLFAAGKEEKKEKWEGGRKRRRRVTFAKRSRMNLVRKMHVILQPIHEEDFLFVCNPPPQKKVFFICENPSWQRRKRNFLKEISLSLSFVDLEGSQCVWKKCPFERSRWWSTSRMETSGRNTKKRIADLIKKKSPDSHHSTLTCYLNFDFSLQEWQFLILLHQSGPHGYESPTKY